MKLKYQDLVIKDGKFVGKFEEMYQKFSDPWNLLKKNKLDGGNLNYKIIYDYCKKLKQKKKLTTLEIGCGFPQISNELLKNDLKFMEQIFLKPLLENLKKNIQN